MSEYVAPQPDYEALGVEHELRNVKARGEEVIRYHVYRSSVAPHELVGSALTIKQHESTVDLSVWSFRFQYWSLEHFLVLNQDELKAFRVKRGRS